jgi:hypothetical protein
VSQSRTHKILLALWDVARDNPRYNKRVWSELQETINELETRNKLLRCVVADLLGSTNDEGRIEWERASSMSPPHGYAIKFLAEELRREKEDGTYAAFKQINGLLESGESPALKNNEIDFVIDLNEDAPQGLGESSDELAIE